MLRPRRLALAASLVFAAHVVFLLVVPPISISADAGVYDQLGRGFAAGQGYRLLGEPVTDLMPVYPFVIGAVYAAFGPHPWLIRILQAACIAFAASSLYLLMRPRWGERAAVVGFLVVSLLPAWFVYPGTLNAESVLLALELVFLCLAFHKPDALPVAALAGAACGLLALTKPEFFVWLPVPALVAERRRAFAFLMASAVCFAVVLAPWAIRNAITFHRFIPLSTKSGHTLWISGHQPELTEFGGPEFARALERCRVVGDPKATDDCLMADAKRQIAQHPAYFVRGAVGRVVHTLFGSHTEYVEGLGVSFTEARRTGRFFVLLGKAGLLILHGIVVVIGVAGIVWLCRTRRQWFLLYLLVAKVAVHGLVFGTARYGLHLTPVLAIGCGAVAQRLWPEST
jgi:4-amino-4-deoxy-L-arabinose transferase-like glycosyltransferase